MAFKGNEHFTAHTVIDYKVIEHINEFNCLEYA
jgi:hypothetical protein